MRGRMPLISQASLTSVSPKGHENIASMLCDVGADPNVTSEEEGQEGDTLLHLACLMVCLLSYCLNPALNLGGNLGGNLGAASASEFAGTDTGTHPPDTAGEAGAAAAAAAATGTGPSGWGLLTPGESQSPLVARPSPLAGGGFSARPGGASPVRVGKEGAAAPRLTCGGPGLAAPGLECLRAATHAVGLLLTRV